MNREELLTAHRDTYAQYHHHKEKMAYAASVLYLAGAAVLMFADGSALALAKTLKIAFAAVAFVAAFAFVAWQLRNRETAADVVEACERLLARPHAEQTPSDLNDPRTYRGLHFPHYLVDELVVVAESRKALLGARTTEILTYVTMIAVAILVAIRITA